MELHVLLRRCSPLTAACCRYHAHWLHSAARVQVAGGGLVEIDRVDQDDGALVAHACDSGEVVKLWPGESSFDMTHNLIKRKE